MLQVKAITLIGPAARPGLTLLHRHGAFQPYLTPQCRAALSTLSSMLRNRESSKTMPNELHDVRLFNFSVQRQYRCDAGMRLKESATKSSMPAKISRDTQYDPEVIGERPDEPPVGENTMMHPVYSEEEVNSVKITHVEPKGFVEKLAYAAVQAMRWSFDFFSGYKRGTLTENKMLTRIIFLETTAGVPGMVGGMVRHLSSLRRMQRDHGWIHTLLCVILTILDISDVQSHHMAEAENERMHLMTAVHLKQPGLLFRGAVLFAQGIFVNGFFLAYLCSPRFCHRFVGYLEEEAVKTYTSCLEHIDNGSLGLWRTKAAPKAAVRYWRLNDDATMRDMILAIRADEAHHRQVNHVLASIRPTDYNPFTPDAQQKNSIEITKEVVRQLDERTEREEKTISNNTDKINENNNRISS